MSTEIHHRTRLVYGGLALLWVLVLAWQVLEHRRVRAAARAELINRARDISTTLGLVMRSQRRFGGLVSRDRIESALNSLIRPGELNAIALLNDTAEIVASAGSPLDFELKALVPSTELWRDNTVALMNLVDLGTTNPAAEPDSRSATIVVGRGELPPPFGTNRPPPPPGAPEGVEPGSANPEAPAPPLPRRDAPAPEDVLGPAPPPPDAGTNGAPRQRQRRRLEGRFPFGRPGGMSEEEYRSLAQRQGVHSFVLVLSTASMRAATRQDLFLRLVISGFASISAIGLGLAWQNLLRTSGLEVRLARAAELNARLREMNLAAAGLAHETRNPLNIIRGLAQLISRQSTLPPELHQRATDIIAETDRVTAQLNEFINYSRPREVRWTAVALGPAVAEVARALTSDLEDRRVLLRVAPDLPVIDADEQLMRQTLFNLLLNAIQAVEEGGEIEIAAQRTGPGEAQLEIRDNGPGVAAEHRQEIFKPYFTTRSVGTGLGLAIVSQIVLAHGWEVECLPNTPRGAIFRLSRLHTTTRS